MTRLFLIGAALVALTGCGSTSLDSVSGNATLQNGVVNGTLSVQTPLGVFTFPSAPNGAPSPQITP